MDKRFSALEANYLLTKNFSTGEAQLIFKQIKDIEILQVAAWPDTLEQVGKKLSNHMNFSKIPMPNKVISREVSAMMRIEPLKWWILNSDIPILSTEEATTLDLSDSFTCLEIQGEKSVIFLNKFLPLDLRENSFSLDCFASSIIHHVSIKLRRTKNSYQLFIPRGFALSLWEIFLESASQFNYEVR